MFAAARTTACDEIIVNQDFDYWSVSKKQYVLFDDQQTRCLGLFFLTKGGTN